MRDYNEILQFVEREIVPRYDGFDAGHNRDHVHTVISQAMSLAQYYPEVDRCLLLIAAAYHDLGLINGREHHHTDSARIVRRRLMDHMREKYDYGGYLKLWIPQGDNAKRLEEFRQTLADEQAFRRLFDTIYDQLTI